MRGYTYPIEIIRLITTSDGAFGKIGDETNFEYIRSCMAEVVEKQANRLTDSEAMLFQNYYSITFWNNGVEIKPEYLIRFENKILEIKGINDKDNKRKTTLSCVAQR